MNYLTISSFKKPLRSGAAEKDDPGLQDMAHSQNLHSLAGHRAAMPDYPNALCKGVFGVGVQSVQRVRYRRSIKSMCYPVDNETLHLISDTFCLLL
jgi:hypothetical protein